MKSIIKLNSVLNSTNGNQVYLIENLTKVPLELEPDKKYKIEIKELKSDRTLKQNRYMWGLINEIAKKQEQDEMDIYSLALEEANAKYVWLKGFPDVKSDLLKSYRAVRITRYDENNLAIFKCYIGSSKMSTTEMMKVIEILERWAFELGIPTLKDIYY